MIKLQTPFLLLLAVPLVGCATRGELKAANERTERMGQLLQQSARDHEQNQVALRQMEDAAATREATLQNQMDAKEALQRLVLVNSTVAAYSEELIYNRKRRAKLEASGEARSHQLANLDTRFSQLERALADDHAARTVLNLEIADVKAIVGEHSDYFETLEGGSSDTARSLVGAYEGQDLTGVN